MKQLTDFELNRFCATEIMKWKEIWFSGDLLWGPDEDHIMSEGEVDFLNNPELIELLLKEMAKKWCAEISCRTVSDEGKILEQWNCYFWEPSLKALGKGAKHQDPDLKRAVVIAAWKAETGQFYEPQTGYKFIEPVGGPIVFDGHVSKVTDTQVEFSKLPLSDQTAKELREELDKVTNRMRMGTIEGEEE